MLDTFHALLLHVPDHVLSLDLLLLVPAPEHVGGDLADDVPGNVWRVSDRKRGSKRAVLTNILFRRLLRADGKSYDEEVVDAGRHLRKSSP